MLEIERKLNIVVNMPQRCSMCKKQVKKRNGNSSAGVKTGDYLCFHSIDGNHDNWEWGNKAPMHIRCHLGYHSMAENTDRHAKASITKFLKSGALEDNERVLLTIKRLRRDNITVTKTKIMQSTGWRKDKTKEILNEMIKRGEILALPAKSGNKTYVHYVELLGAEL